VAVAAEEVSAAAAAKDTVPNLAEVEEAVWKAAA
jgi:hypothetical protein